MNTLTKAFEKNHFNHLPEIIITGRKKCGTKAILTFLLQHPKIFGSREEFHWHDTGDFNRDFKAFLGHHGYSYKQRSISWQVGSHLIAKFGNRAIWITDSITKNSAIIEPSIGSRLMNRNNINQKTG